MRFAPRTILGQLTAASVLVQLFVFGCFLAISVRREFQQTEARDQQRLANQTRTIASVVAGPLASRDTESLDQLMRIVPVSTTIQGVRVTDAQGKTLAQSGSALWPELQKSEQDGFEQVSASRRYTHLTDRSNHEEGIAPVIKGNLVLGYVWVRPNTGVTLRYSVTALHNVLLYGAVALVSNLLAVCALSGTIARPLRLLRRATQQIRSDHNDLSGFPLPVPAMNEAGELTASFNAMVQELAEQRRGTQETLSLLDAMLSSAPIGFAFYDRKCRYVRVNEHLARMHGLPIEAHLGNRLRDLLPPGASPNLADLTENLVSKVVETGQPIPDQELSGTAPDEKGARTYQASYFPVFVANREVRWVGVIATEITERKRTEEAMRRSEKLAAAGRLAASIAHEINNPLESVTNLLYLIRQHPTLDATAAEYTALAQQELSRVAEITQQTLRFYRQSSHPVDVRLPEVLRSVLMLHHARMQSPHIDVRLRLNEDAVLFGYAGELRQVFANLIGNAIDAMPAGGCIWVRAHFAMRNGRPGVKVTVADAGTGMAEAVRRRIFEPFFTTKEATGTGLGLWVSAEILSKHRAVAQVRSRTARYRGDCSGTVFSLFFPHDGVPRGPVRVTLPVPGRGV